MSAADATMTVMIDGEERSRLIAGYMESGDPYPEMLNDEVVISMPGVSPMMIAHVIQQKSWTLKDGTTVSLSDREEESTEGFEILQYVALDEVVTEKVKGEVSEWPPAIIKAEFGDETFYYNLADCHKKS